MRNAVFLVAALCVSVSQTLEAAPPDPPHSSVSDTDAAFFESRVRPILANSCYGCHGPDQQLSSLRVDSRDALLKGGKRGPSLVPGNPTASWLIKAVRHEDLKMPVGGKLKDAEISALEDWVRRGAPWPQTTTSQAPAAKDRYAELVRTHWAYQKVNPPAVPPGSQSALDRFITARLQAAGLKMAAPADRRILIRRLSYVLTGLPPAADEAERFERDTSPDAYARLVDRMLASPHFGEQWARHWLDVVRYAETRGYEWNYEIVGAWRYRDYLIRAFNQDVPYNQLVREHIAGDLLPAPRINRQDGINESLIGTAFYRLGEAGHDDCTMFREIALDVVDNQIDTLTKAFQGLTVSCARCHNHKLDPIPTQDYYGLYSVLNSSRAVTHTLDLPDLHAQTLSRLDQLKQDARRELASLWKRDAAQIGAGIVGTVSAQDPTDDKAKAWKAAIGSASGKPEDPAYPLEKLLCETASQERWLSDSAAALSAYYRTEAASRSQFNREHYQRLADLSDWYASGSGLRNGATAAGDFALATEGDQAVAGVFGRGIYTNKRTSRLNGALRSPFLPKDRKYISMRVAGGGLSARRIVIDNCAIGETYKVLENDAPQWFRMDTFAAQKDLPVFAEFVTRWDNPRIPDRPGVLKPEQVKLLNSPRSWFGVLDVVLHDNPETPKEELSHMLPLFGSGPIRTWRELGQRYQQIVTAAVDRWASGNATDDDARWLDWLTRNGILSNRSDASPSLQQSLTEYRRLEATIPEPRVIDGLADMGEGRDYRVLVSGNPKNFGDTAPRRFLQKILGDAPIQTHGSGRRELAEIIADPANPLTARVMVNRIWSYVFGRGIVLTTDNFGLLGDRPSHPELLDYLATEFIKQGWSVKQMVRLLVTSDAFMQSGEITAHAREVDPENRLLHHYPLRRLEAESIRDSLLMSSGKLQNSMYGPSTDPFRDQAKDYRRLFSGPLEGDGRRSLYLKITRMEGPKFLEIFDYPSPMAARGSRDVTNVPAQALTLLNDPFVIAEAEACAQRLLSQSGDSVDRRIEELFGIVLSRKPTEVERERFRGLAAELGSLYHVPRQQLADNTSVWKDLSHAAFNLKEFIYVQ